MRSTMHLLMAAARPAFLLIGLGLLCALPAGSAEDPVSVVNDFGNAYNEWAHIITTSPTSTFNAAGYLKWKEVKNKWNRARHAVDQAYGY